WRLACDYSGRVYAMHPCGVQDRYFNSLRNRIKMGTVVSTPTARRASPALRRSSFSRALLSRRPIPTPSAPRVIAINPISGSVRVMRFALMFIYLLHTFDSHPVSAAVRPLVNLSGLGKAWNQAAEDLKVPASASS